jgi:hypothetical protein
VLVETEVVDGIVGRAERWTLNFEDADAEIFGGEHLSCRSEIDSAVVSSRKSSMPKNSGRVRDVSSGTAGCGG